MNDELFLKLFEKEWIINDTGLWDKFNSFYEDRIHFLGLSYEDSQFEGITKEDSKFYIDQINRIFTKEKKRKHNFSFSSCTNPILRLWRELLKDAIVYLKQSDEREVYHDRETFGVDELFKYFERFIEFEEVLYENIHFYRDHVLHVFRVFLLGLIILFEKIGLDKLNIYEKGLKKDLTNLGITPKESNLDQTISNEEKIAMWIIISLTHDLGYPLEKLSNINQKVRNMLEAFGRSNIQEIDITFPPQGEFINDFVLRFLSSRSIVSKDIRKNNNKKHNLKVNDLRFGLHLQSKYWIKFSKSFEEYDHGIMSCILLMKYLVYFLEADYLLDNNHDLNFKNQRQFQIRREILRSIASHNCEYIYHLAHNNFSFLLTIVDDLQCWGRPSGRMTNPERSWGVKLNEYTRENIEFTIILSESISNKDMRQIFFAHTRKYTKILRGGVDGKQRKFDLCFRVLISKEKYLNNEDGNKKRIVGLEYFHKVPKSQDDYYLVHVNEHYYDGEYGNELNIPFHVYIAHTNKKNCSDKLYKEIKKNLSNKRDCI